MKLYMNGSEGRGGGRRWRGMKVGRQVIGSAEERLRLQAHERLTIDA